MIGQDGGWVRASIGAEAKASLCISQGRVLRTLVDYQSPTQVRAHSLPEGSRGRTSRSASGARAKKEHGGHIILGISNIIIVGIRQVSNLALATAWYRIVAYFVDAHSLKLRKKQVLFFGRPKRVFIDLSDMFGVTRCLCKLFKLFNTPFFLLQDYSKEQRERWLISGWRSPSRRKMSEAKRSSLSAKCSSSSHR